MTSNEADDLQMDRYLDGLMSTQESAQFLKTVDKDLLQQARDMQSQIDGSLKRMVSFEGFNKDDLAMQFAGATELAVEPGKQAASGFLNKPSVRVAVAAAVLLAASLGIWFNSGSGLIKPATGVRSLAAVYTEKVDSGFEPYYFCDDDVRFANTFESRVGQALVLAELPANAEMLGISWLGGISRNTTAMLCKVDEQKVVVFVDRSDEPGQSVATVDVDQDGLNVFVVEKNGLVFCEVTPLESPRMIEYFEFKN